MENFQVIPGANVVSLRLNFSKTYEIAEVQIGELFLSMIRRAETVAVDFMPSSVRISGKGDLWNFRDENFPGIAKLHIHRPKPGVIEHFIVLVNFGEVHKVIRIEDFLQMKKIRVAGNISYIGGMTVLEQIELKKEIARKMELRWRLSDREQEISRKAWALEQERRQKKERQKMIERENRRREIINRSLVSGFSEHGDSLSGIPVLESEWECLPDGSRAVLVETFDEKGKPGKMLEAFFVKKNGGGRCAKDKVKNIFPTREKADVSAIGTIILLIEEQVEEYHLFSQEGIDALSQRGTNGGITVALNQPDENRAYPIIRFGKNGPKQIGYFPSI